MFYSPATGQKKTKETANEAGQVVAKTGSEFVNGVSKGIKKTFSNEIIFSDELKKKGLKAGKITIGSSDSSSTDNVLIVYLIFDQNINQTITAKIFDEDGHEYGRTMQNIAAQQNEAKYFDFVFDKRTDIESKGKVILE